MIDEKIDKLEGKMDEILRILLEHSNRFEQIDHRFEQIDQRFEQIDQRFEQIDKKIGKIDGTLGEFEAILLYHSELLQKHDKKLKEHDEKFNSIERTLFLIEDAVSNKIPALFDAYQMHQDHQEISDKRIDELEETVENHTVRLISLEMDAKTSA